MCVCVGGREGETGGRGGKREVRERGGGVSESERQGGCGGVGGAERIVIKMIS